MTNASDLWMTESIIPLTLNYYTFVKITVNVKSQFYKGEFVQFK